MIRLADFNEKGPPRRVSATQLKCGCCWQITTEYGEEVVTADDLYLLFNTLTRRELRHSTTGRC